MNNFSDVLKSVVYINIYNDGNVKSLNSDSENFSDLIKEIETLFNNTREMPAFGVSLHCETILSIKNGLWVELGFECVKDYNNMSFEKLLFKINKEDCGFNIIRFNNNRYEGRCFYFDIINGNMCDFYIKLLNFYYNQNHLSKF